MSTRKTLDERMAEMTTDTERQLFNACCFALGALGASREPNAAGVYKMLESMMGVADPLEPSPPAEQRRLSK